MTMTDSEPEEVWQVRVLLRGLRYYPEPRVEPGPPPEPDVIVWPAGSATPLGIEVTHINPLGEARRRAEGEADIVVKMAQRQYENAGGPPLIVGVIWSHGFNPVKSRRHQTVRDLVGLVRSNIPAIGERVELDAGISGTHALPHGIDRVSINQVTDIEGYWHSPRVAFVPDIAVSDVKAALARKNPKHRNYRQAYSATWLVLVASGAGPASWGNIGPEVRRLMHSLTDSRHLGG